MRALLDDQLAAALSEDRQRNLVAHRRGRQVDRLFLAEQLGRPPFEREHRRVFALLLVADLGVRHRVAHRSRRPRLGVGTEVDHASRRIEPLAIFESELRACLAFVLGEDVPPPAYDAPLFYRHWLGGRNLGLVPIASPATFSWPGYWVARVSSGDGDHAVAMYGSPSGPVLDPASAYGAAA